MPIIEVCLMPDFIKFLYFFDENLPVILIQFIYILSPAFFALVEKVIKGFITCFFDLRLIVPSVSFKPVPVGLCTFLWLRVLVDFWDKLLFGS